MQSNLGRKLKENLDLFNMGMNQPGYIQSDSEEENSQTNEKYYQNFLDRLYNDGNHGNSKNKYQENKMYRKNKCILSFDEYGYSNNIINSTIMFYKCIY